ncbi:MAG TPA: hypothetical protein VMW19_07985 [Myxococcota bacterium]|nr:hypothetical protein [Myxococcota bacterium]
MSARSRPHLAGAALAAALALACSKEAPRYGAPAEERAALVLEPPQVALGDVADVLLSVVTRPGARIAPVDPPSAIPGFWFVEREELPVQKEPARWIHRTRLRIRAVEVGHFEFPGGEVHGENEEGAALEVRYEPLALEVLSSLSDGPERRTPFGVRRLPAPPVGGASAAVAFGAGAVVALGAVGVVSLARRRLALRPVVARPTTAPSAPAWVIATSALADAQALRESDPRGALDAAARALRRYAEARFGADAPARSVEELLAATPPFLMTTRWSAFVSLLASLDAARFAPRPDAERAAHAEPLLRAARDFVDETTPPESRR